MDGKAFDQAARRLATSFSRRGLWGIATGVGLGAATARLPITADARKKGKRKKTPKLKLNAFGCVNVGGFCKNGGQCCSGICQGKKGKKRCVAHNAGECQANEDSCAGVNALCGGNSGICGRTTGKASFCGNSGLCRTCKKDTDCEAEFGLGAACIVCSACEETGGTACGAAAA